MSVEDTSFILLGLICRRITWPSASWTLHKSNIVGYQLHLQQAQFITMYPFEACATSDVYRYHLVKKNTISDRSASGLVK